MLLKALKCSQLPFVPELMKLLLELHGELRKASRLLRCQQHCYQAWFRCLRPLFLALWSPLEALCGAAVALLPWAEPGKVSALDGFIAFIVQELRTVEIGGEMSFETLVNMLGKAPKAHGMAHFTLGGADECLAATASRPAGGRSCGHEAT